MTDTPKETPRLLTEDEAYAIAAAMVKRETADRDDKIKALESEKAELAKAAQDELATQGDLNVVALDAERERANAAEKALADFKVEIENEKAAAARIDERVAKVREVAKHLKDDFFTAERASRWAGWEDQQFEDYVRELAEVCVVSTTTPAGDPPRETAMAGTAVQGKTTGNLKTLWGV